MAVQARETRAALTSVGVDIVMTSCAVQARIGSTLVDIGLAEISSEPIDTNALVAVDSIDAGSSIEAGILFAIVCVQEAISSLKSGSAFTSVRSLSVDTSRSVSARLVCALVDVLVTVAPGPSQGTRATVISVVG